MEHGKDIIAINPNGEYCAYQLKGVDRKIKLKQWKEELLPQVIQLIHTPIIHPSVQTGDHNSYFVTNGDLEEEVSAAIKAMNDNWQLKGLPKKIVQPILKGDILHWASKLKTDFFPTEVKDVKSLLEFFLEDGSAILDKSKFSSLLKAHFNTVLKSKSESRRVVSSGALLCSLATSKYDEKKNHIVNIDAWTLFISYLFWFAEKNNLKVEDISNEVAIAEKIIFNALENLEEEIVDIKDFIVGNRIADSFILKQRILYVCGYISYLGYRYALNGEIEKAVKIEEKVHGFMKHYDLWGESSIPYLLSSYWFLKVIRPMNAKQILAETSLAVLRLHSNASNIFPSPYYDIDESISLRHNEDSLFVAQHNDVGTSYYLQSLIYLCVLNNLRAFLEKAWPFITKINLEELVPDKINDYLLWRCEGVRHFSCVNKTESWSKLKADIENSTSTIPSLLKDNMHLFPLFLFALPHRINWKHIIAFEKFNELYSVKVTS